MNEDVLIKCSSYCVFMPSRSKHLVTRYIFFCAGSDGPSTGLIVGIIVGVLVFIVIVVGVVYYLKKKKK